MGDLRNGKFSGATFMEKRISVWSYWAGVVCVVLTTILRLLAAVDIWPHFVPQGGAGISYYTFLRGGVLLLLLSIASRQMANSRGGQ